MLAEYVAIAEEGLVALPASLSYEEGATLPCAGVTAWNSLMVSGNRMKPGDTALCLGTRGGGAIMSPKLEAWARCRTPFKRSHSPERWF
jgi:NADPH:quinone reductase-like Zn-dependent oxidoreductase